MKQYAPFVIVVLAILIAVLTVLGDNSYSRLKGQRAAIEEQKEKNAVLGARVEELRSRVQGLQSSDRDLEKAARNELGMAHPNEMIFLFDDRKQGNRKNRESAGGTEKGTSPR